MPFTLPKLPYAYDALEPYIDAKTMEIHHDKHHATYIAKLNDALAKHPELVFDSFETLLKDLGKIPEEIRTAVKNHGGGSFHHSFLWPLLKKNEGGKPVGKLAQEIDKKFGNYDGFREQFAASASLLFGSGWVWLTVNPKGDLEIIQTPNQDSPITMGHKPIITIDVWEHAYYLKYQNQRPEYIEAYFDVLNWEQAEGNFNR